MIKTLNRSLGLMMFFRSGVARGRNRHITIPRGTWILVFLILLLFVGGAAAQDTVTGAFQGDVSNNRTGDPIAGVAVQITNVQTGVVYNLTTDSKGRFYQGLLAPGSYDISVTVVGFKQRLLRREIKVSLTGEVVPVPVSLEPETAPSAQPATLEPPDDIRVEINTSDARRGDSTKKEEIETIPIGASSITRSFDELALLLPGVAPPPQTIGDVAGPGVGPGVGSAGQFAVNGLRSRGNNFTVDGSDNNDEDIGVRRQGFVAFVPQPIESIQEFQITTLLAPAQFGRNMGAQVNAVSRAGGNLINGTIYGTFNSHQLNARNFFDTARGNGTSPLTSASGQAVLLDGQPVIVRNQSGGEDPFTFGQGGGTVGGAIIKNKLFYFVSGEYQKINASREKSFAVPTIEQRGAFGTGATGTYRNPYTNAATAAIPNTESSAALLSLFPFPNDPNGLFGANTFTQILPAGGRGTILSGRLDDNFEMAGRQHTFTARYNFTDDDRNIPSVNEAIFSTVRSQIRTNNISIFLNSQLDKSSVSSGRLFNQIRFSVGHTRLNFDEARDRSYLIPSTAFPDIPFLLNAPLRFNITQPTTPGSPNTGPVRFSGFDPFATTRREAENLLGPIGEVIIAGFSPLGTDVYNFPQNRRNLTYQIADELTYRIGAHNLVAGLDIRRTGLNSDLPRLSRPLVTFNGAPRLSPSTGTCPNGGIGNYCFPAAGDPNPVIRPEDLAALGAASNFLLTFNIDRPDSKVDLRYYQFNFYGQDTWRIREGLSLSAGLRYEYNTPVSESNNLIERTFTDDRLSLVPGLDTFIDGRRRLYEPDRNNFAPRIGIAYSPKLFGGSRVSVFRAGYGIFYDQILGAVANQSRNVFPTFLTINLGGLAVFGDGLLNLTNPGVLGYPLANGTIVPVQLPGTINQYNPEIALADFVNSIAILYPNWINATLPSRNLQMPAAQHYSVSYEQQLNSRFVASVAYVGTTGRHLLRFTTPNLGSSLTTAPTALIVSPVPSPFGTLLLPQNRGVTFIPTRPIDRVGGINQFETTASSRYDSLQAQLRGRFINSFNLQLSYTYSKVTDDVSDVFDLAGAYVLPQNSFDLPAERGPANFDVRHRWTYDLIYSFPKTGENGFLRHLTNDLQIATTGRFHSGQPFTVNSVIDINLDGNLTDRLNTNNGIEITGDRRQPLRLTASTTLALLAPYGQNGQIGRNSFRAGNVLELDLSVIKQFNFGSNRLGFRADIFNFIDRANFGVPIRLLEAPGFGKAASTVTPGRRVQFSVKYEF